MLYNKIVKLLENDIIPIFCVGEHLEEKERNITKDIVGKQIMEVFDKLDTTNMEKIIIAYEPIWSIGTGKIPTNEEIIDVTNYIKDLIQDKYEKRNIVLYGGSVNKDNIDILNTIDVVDGYLIGGASTKPAEFMYIMSKCE
jgi:triosephosphate isomerase